MGLFDFLKPQKQLGLFDKFSKEKARDGILNPQKIFNEDDARIHLESALTDYFTNPEVDILVFPDSFRGFIGCSFHNQNYLICGSDIISQCRCDDGKSIQVIDFFSQMSKMFIEQMKNQ